MGAEVELVIDPGQAFGTGAHATTRLCLELMLELAAARPGTFLDLGCGSGVLAIAAARLGWDPVVALDYDPASVEAGDRQRARERRAIEVRRHDLRVDPVATAPHGGGEPAEAAAAGMGGAAGGGARAAALPETVIASGLLRRRGGRGCAARSRRSGWCEAGRRESGEWAALLLERRR